MDPVGAHARAQGVFASVLAGIGDDQLGQPTPCGEWTVRDVVDHVIGGNGRVAGAAASAGAPAPAPPGPDASLADLARAHRASAEGAIATFAEPGAMSQIFELRIGQLPGSIYVGMRATDAFAHAWDLARATGQASDLDPELAEAVLGLARSRIRPELRGDGMPFATEVPCDPSRPAADRVAAFLGRPVD